MYITTGGGRAPHGGGICTNDQLDGLHGGLNAVPLGNCHFTGLISAPETSITSTFFGLLKEERFLDDDWYGSVQT